MRAFILGGLATLLLSACDIHATINIDADDGDDTSTTGGGCTHGEPGCSCAANFECAPGLSCVNGVCVDLPQPFCGNGLIEGGEQCDEFGETPSCDKDCTIAVCGDGYLNPFAGEQCDEGPNNGFGACSTTCTFQTAENHPAVCQDGFDNDFDGFVDCDDTDCQVFVPWLCVGVCGDGILQPGEQCDDGNVVNGDGCTTQCTFEQCGNGVVEPGEACDGTDLNNQSCFSLGYSGGLLSCHAMCGFDTSNCSSCGNGVIDGGETCDGADLGGQTCTSLGFTGGALACDPMCFFDETQCF